VVPADTIRSGRQWRLSPRVARRAVRLRKQRRKEKRPSGDGPFALFGRAL